MKKVDQNNDYSGDPPPDLESIRKDVQKCRENRERLLREKALQRRFQKEPEKRMQMSDDEEKERIRRRNIGLIVQLEWEKLESEKKRRIEQIGVGNEDEEEEEDEPRKSDASPGFQDSNNSKIGVGHGEEKSQKEPKLVGENKDEEWEPKKSNNSDRQPSTQDSQPEMPEELKNHIQDMGGRNVKFLTQRTMCRTDEVSYMPVPLQQLLTEQEERMFSEEGIGIEVEVVEPSLQHSRIPIRKWKSKHGHNYVFTNKNRTDLVQRNAIGKGTVLQLWTFRNIRSMLCFAVVRV